MSLTQVQKEMLGGVPTGSAVQVVNTITGAVATGTTTVTPSDSVPQQSSFGDQYMTLAITPQSSTNKLRIDVVVQFGHSANIANIFAALFQDSTANALATAGYEQANAGRFSSIAFTYFMTAGTTSSTTFKVRLASDTSGTLTFNGSGGGRYWGGTSASSITITEIQS